MNKKVARIIGIAMLLIMVGSMIAGVVVYLI